ncbi:hypothetical protein GCM10010218_18270 [Streptomyces mashuensis]|uniref:RDD domain-containing protein n=1 Tax=Streptomyces mashuensis TaxID=33904 RepID=A0A919B0D3_9ACTN|nr:RDD family protein [Streptomyces mashuensis]GHF37048.1 hypothetical protein GCM10010218_18270 [Streptomyces mashuensis]
MSTDEPQEPPPPASGAYPGGPPPAGGPVGGGGPAGPGGPPPPTGPPPGGTPPGGPYGGGPYGGGPYGSPPPPGHGGPYPGAPYGGPPSDPLAGMPPLANRFKRLIARIIDGLLVSVPVSIVFTFAAGHYDPWNDQNKSTGLSIIVALVYFVYEGLMLSTRGQTVGKMAMKIRVAMLENGAIPQGAPGWTRAAVYSLPEVVLCCGFVFWLVNVLWCLWDEPYHQCVHDKAAKTVVVSTAG